VSRILLSALPPMHRFPALPQPLRAYLGAQARRFNTALQDFAATQDDCIWVPLEMGTDVSLMASDGFHPGAAAYAAWAEHLASWVGPGQDPAGTEG
jgi:lysophospholipase L1-like esterase